MKKYIFAMALAISSMATAQAQRMIPGQKGLEIGTGILSKEFRDHYYLNMALTINGKNGNYRIGGLEYSYRLAHYKDLRIPMETYTGEVGYSFLLWGDYRRTIALYAGLTAVAGYESINRGKNLLSDGARILDENSFIYGAGGRLSLETYISDRFVFLLQGRSKIFWGTDLKQLRPSAGVGLRFNF
ncbi:conjugal transfer protein TraO [Parapedobacter sp. 10938]|uniref:conjugal transfer protein TraO n=1 Tax=Parapedobacter flavus TaxID=3110225 RepID=UPI002DBD6FA4|nr:conjugal transfer protein TraO [Parapedobacter sp. 10938]MEC3880279.1 conjugal transfer protein TraO [Parapedobacter sp. 10938]